MSYETFKKTAAALGLDNTPGRHTVPLETVDQLQRKLLTLSQLDAVRMLQEGMQAMADIQASINSLIALHRLPLAAISLPQLGLVQHQLEGVLFEHGLAASKLAKGGQPVASTDNVLPFTRAA
jgi:hypothetical protein